MLIESTNPATGELIGSIQATQPEIIPEIIKKARTGQQGWGRLPFSQRAKIVGGFGRLLYDKRSEVVELISRENGKPKVEAYTSEIIPTLDIIKYAIKNCEHVLKPRRVRIGIPLLKTKKAYVANEPYGVVGIISPWNYPLLLPLGQIVPALLLGNAVIFKPSEHTPILGDLISRLLLEAGIPADVFNIVQGDGKVGAAIISSGVNKVFFTGSTANGRRVSEIAAKHLIPVSLELGSKDAMVALEDAYVDSATSAAMWGAFMNAGQTCVSIERCFVHEKIYDRFVAVLSEKAERLSVGPGSLVGTDIGSMIHQQQFDTVKRHIDEAVAKGARIAFQGKVPTGHGHFISPTLLTDVPMESSIMTEETFGPVLPIVKFRSDEEGVALANSSRFGLGASVWTADRRRGLEIAKRLEAGAVVVNDVISYYGIGDGVVGGVKDSGYGRVHGDEGFLELVYAKYYEVERMPRMKKLWWYKYDRDTLSFFEAATEFLYAKGISKRLKPVFRILSTFLRTKKI